MQGLPAVALGFLVYFLLEDKPDDAAWLSRDEKQLIDDSLLHDVKDVESERAGTFGQMLRDPKVYVLSLVYFLLLGATYTMVFWVPTLIQSWGVKDVLLIGIYAAIPNAVSEVRSPKYVEYTSAESITTGMVRSYGPRRRPTVSRLSRT